MMDLKNDADFDGYICCEVLMRPTKCVFGRLSVVCAELKRVDLFNEIFDTWEFVSSRPFHLRLGLRVGVVEMNGWLLKLHQLCLINTQDISQDIVQNRPSHQSIGYAVQH